MGPMLGLVGGMEGVVWGTGEESQVQLQQQANVHEEVQATRQAGQKRRGRNKRPKVPWKVEWRSQREVCGVWGRAAQEGVAVCVCAVCGGCVVRRGSGKRVKRWVIAVEMPLVAV